MWVNRDFERFNDKFTGKKDVAVKYFGRDGATKRLGRAAMLRRLTSAQYERLKKTDKALSRGPYLPVIIEACGEEELSYEYRHGATSHGAFTYSLAEILRSEKSITFESLVDKVKNQLAELQYQQEPRILGPSSILRHKVPWTAG